MCPKGGQMCQMESVRLSINEHMTSVVGEDILCVLEKQSDACCVKLVRVFVLERLSAAAEWMCNLFQREIETLETLLDHQSKLLDMAFNVDTQLHTAEGHEGRSSSLQQEAGTQEQEVLPGRPEEAVSTSILLQKKTTCDFQDLPECKEERVSSEHLERLSEHLERSSSEHLERSSSEHLERSSSEHLERSSGLLQEDAVPPQFQQGAPIPGAERAEAALLSVKSEDEEDEDEEGESRSMWNPSSTEEEKPFSCMFCCKSFNLNGNLKRHMRIHTGERPFSCTICDKRFGEKKDLHRHMRTHTGEKPFSCAVCNKRFSESSSLKTHMTIHTGEKRFICTVCGKGWCKKDDLTKHMRIHTGEKPFMCTICSRCFSRGETLKKHIRTHRGKPL